MALFHVIFLVHEVASSIEKKKAIKLGLIDAGSLVCIAPGAILS